MSRLLFDGDTADRPVGTNRSDVWSARVATTH
jgi:hypothetical protein